MSQSAAREEMLKQFTAFNLAQNINSPNKLSIIEALAVGSPSGYEALLPKYSISTGRDGEAEAISQARIYLDLTSEEFKKQDIKLGDIDVGGQSYVGFLLSAVQENRSEKVQTTPLNGDNFSTTFYGEAPAIYTFQGILYNTHFARWRELFGLLYQGAFRGSKISRHRKILHIVYDNKIVSGWMLNLSQNINSASDTMANFNFQFLVRTEVLLATEKELSFNNSYFTGAPIQNKSLDSLASLPIYDDYLNVSRIKPPPKRQAGLSGGKKTYPCLPGKGETIREGKRKKARTRFKGQSISPGSPVSTDCDVSRAALEVLRRRNNEIEDAKKRFKKGSPALTAAISKADRKAQESLETTYSDLANIEKIDNKSAKKRAEDLRSEFKGNLSTDLKALAKYTPDKVAQIQKKINNTELDYSTTNAAKN